MRQDRTNIDIKIPFDLARYLVSKRRLVVKYETNQLIRALDTWLVLKHETTSGYIHGWNEQKVWLCAICKCSETILRHRLKLLQQMELIKYDRRGIWVCSWEQLGKRLEIDTDNCFTIKYSIDDKQRVQEWIIATEITDNKQRQEFALLTKLNKNPEVVAAITAHLIAQGADGNRLKDTQYFISMMRSAYMADFVRASDIHDVLIEFRPDNNRSCKGMANAWNCKHAVTVSYWKKKMKGCGIIDVASMQIESQGRARNRYCRVVWLKKEKQTLLCMCDQIDILTPWLRTAEFFIAA